MEMFEILRRSGLRLDWVDVDHVVHFELPHIAEDSDKLQVL